MTGDYCIASISFGSKLFHNPVSFTLTSVNTVILLQTVILIKIVFLINFSVLFCTVIKVSIIA